MSLHDPFLVSYADEENVWPTIAPWIEGRLPFDVLTLKGVGGGSLSFCRNVAVHFVSEGDASGAGAASAALPLPSLSTPHKAAGALASLGVGVGVVGNALGAAGSAGGAGPPLSSTGGSVASGVAFFSPEALWSLASRPLVRLLVLRYGGLELYRQQQRRSVRAWVDRRSELHEEWLLLVASSVFEDEAAEAKQLRKALDKVRSDVNPQGSRARERVLRVPLPPHPSASEAEQPPLFGELLSVFTHRLKEALGCALEIRFSVLEDAVQRMQQQSGLPSASLFAAKDALASLQAKCGRGVEALRLLTSADFSRRPDVSPKQIEALFSTVSNNNPTAGTGAGGAAEDAKKEAFLAPPLLLSERRCPALLTSLRVEGGLSFLAFREYLFCRQGCLLARLGRLEELGCRGVAFVNGLTTHLTQQVGELQGRLWGVLAALNLAHFISAKSAFSSESAATRENPSLVPARRSSEGSEQTTGGARQAAGVSQVLALPLLRRPTSAVARTLTKLAPTHLTFLPSRRTPTQTEQRASLPSRTGEDSVGGGTRPKNSLLPSSATPASLVGESASKSSASAPLTEPQTFVSTEGSSQTTTGHAGSEIPSARTGRPAETPAEGGAVVATASDAFTTNVDSAAGQAKGAAVLFAFAAQQLRHVFAAREAEDWRPLPSSAPWVVAWSLGAAVSTGASEAGNESRPSNGERQSSAEEAASLFFPTDQLRELGGAACLEVWSPEELLRALEEPSRLEALEADVLLLAGEQFVNSGYYRHAALLQFRLARANFARGQLTDCALAIERMLPLFLKEPWTALWVNCKQLQARAERRRGDLTGELASSFILANARASKTSAATWESRKTRTETRAEEEDPLAASRGSSSGVSNPKKAQARPEVGEEDLASSRSCNSGGMETPSDFQRRFVRIARSRALFHAYERSLQAPFANCLSSKSTSFASSKVDREAPVFSAPAPLRSQQSSDAVETTGGREEWQRASLEEPSDSLAWDSVFERVGNARFLSGEASLHLKAAPNLYAWVAVAPASASDPTDDDFIGDATFYEATENPSPAPQRPALAVAFIPEEEAEDSLRYGPRSLARGVSGVFSLQESRVFADAAANAASPVVEGNPRVSRRFSSVFASPSQKTQMALSRAGSFGLRRSGRLVDSVHSRGALETEAFFRRRGDFSRDGAFGGEAGPSLLGMRMGSLQQDLLEQAILRQLADLHPLYKLHGDAALEPQWLLRVYETTLSRLKPKTIAGVLGQRLLQLPLQGSNEPFFATRLSLPESQGAAPSKTGAFRPRLLPSSVGAENQASLTQALSAGKEVETPEEAARFSEVESEGAGIRREGQASPRVAQSVSFAGLKNASALVQSPAANSMRGEEEPASEWADSGGGVERESSFGEGRLGEGSPLSRQQSPCRRLRSRAISLLQTCSAAGAVPSLSVALGQTLEFQVFVHSALEQPLRLDVFALRLARLPSSAQTTPLPTAAPLAPSCWIAVRRNSKQKSSRLSLELRPGVNRLRLRWSCLQPAVFLVEQICFAVGGVVLTQWAGDLPPPALLGEVAEAMDGALLQSKKKKALTKTASNPFFVHRDAGELSASWQFEVRFDGFGGAVSPQGATLVDPRASLERMLHPLLVELRPVSSVWGVRLEAAQPGCSPTRPFEERGPCEAGEEEAGQPCGGVLLQGVQTWVVVRVVAPSGLAKGKFWGVRLRLAQAVLSTAEEESSIDSLEWRSRDENDSAVSIPQTSHQLSTQALGEETTPAVASERRTPSASEFIPRRKPSSSQNQRLEALRLKSRWRRRSSAGSLLNPSAEWGVSAQDSESFVSQLKSQREDSSALEEVEAAFSSGGKQHAVQFLWSEARAVEVDGENCSLPLSLNPLKAASLPDSEDLEKAVQEREEFLREAGERSQTLWEDSDGNEVWVFKNGGEKTDADGSAPWLSLPSFRSSIKVLIPAVAHAPPEGTEFFAEQSLSESPSSAAQPSKPCEGSLQQSPLPPSAFSNRQGRCSAETELGNSPNASSMHRRASACSSSSSFGDLSEDGCSSAFCGSSNMGVLAFASLLEVTVGSSCQATRSEPEQSAPPLPAEEVLAADGVANRAKDFSFDDSGDSSPWMDLGVSEAETYEDEAADASPRLNEEVLSSAPRRMPSHQTQTAGGAGVQTLRVLHVHPALVEEALGHSLTTTRVSDALTIVQVQLRASSSVPFVYLRGAELVRVLPAALGDGACDEEALETLAPEVLLIAPAPVLSPNPRPEPETQSDEFCQLACRLDGGSGLSLLVRAKYSLTSPFKIHSRLLPLPEEVSQPTKAAAPNAGVSLRQAVTTVSLSERDAMRNDESYWKLRIIYSLGEETEASSPAAQTEEGLQASQLATASSLVYSVPFSLPLKSFPILVSLDVPRTGRAGAPLHVSLKISNASEFDISKDSTKASAFPFASKKDLRSASQGEKGNSAQPSKTQGAAGDSPRVGECHDWLMVGAKCRSIELQGGGSALISFCLIPLRPGTLRLPPVRLFYKAAKRTSPDSEPWPCRAQLADDSSVFEDAWLDLFKGNSVTFGRDVLVLPKLVSTPQVQLLQ